VFETDLDERPPIDVALAEPLLTADQVATLLCLPRSSVYE